MHIRNNIMSKILTLILKIFNSFLTLWIQCPSQGQKIRLEGENQNVHQQLVEKEAEVQQIPQLRSQLQQITVSASAS